VAYSVVLLFSSSKAFDVFHHELLARVCLMGCIIYHLIYVVLLKAVWLSGFARNEVTVWLAVV
jgi:uncharacterized membrane protein